MEYQSYNRHVSDVDSSVLVSVIVIATEGFSNDLEPLHRVATFVGSRYAFFELLLIGPEHPEDTARALLSNPTLMSPHIRFLQIEAGVDFDHMAIHGYRECIGDIVVLSSIDELPHVDLDRMISELRRNDGIVRIRRTRSGIGERFSSRIVRSLTGLDVDTRFYRTIGMNRINLGELIAHPEQIAFFRFTASRLFPKQTIIPLDMPPTRQGFARFLSRIDTVVKLIGKSAARLLRFASAICLSLSIISLLVLGYVGVVYFYKANVAEGWSSNVALVAILMFAQMTASAAACLGLSTLLDRHENPRAPRLINETTVSDLFNEVRILNVQTANLGSTADHE